MLNNEASMAHAKEAIAAAEATIEIASNARDAQDDEAFETKMKKCISAANRLKEEASAILGEIPEQTTPDITDSPFREATPEMERIARTDVDALRRTLFGD